MSTASFKIDDEIYIDSNCFYSLIYIKTYEKKYIIIESKKIHFELNKIREYFNDLKKIGFNFTYRYNKKNNSFKLNVSKIINKSKLTMFCMAIRYLWEGKYKPAAYGYDKFYIVIEHYFNLKKLYPNENLLKLLCISCNCFLISKHRINSNHFFSREIGCQLKESINDLRGTVNTYFTENFNFSNKNLLKFKDLKNSKQWSKDNYNEFYEYLINYEKK